MEEGKDQELIHQVLHLTQDTLWERDKSTKKRHIQKRLLRSALSHQVTTRLQDQTQKRLYVKDERK